MRTFLPRYVPIQTLTVPCSMFVATIPAVLWVDNIGRKPVLVSGAMLMAACHIIVAILTSQYHNSWPEYVLSLLIPRLDH